MAVVKKSDGITDLITALTSNFARKSSKVSDGYLLNVAEAMQLKLLIPGNQCPTTSQVHGY